jgi:phenylpropionate dioxygenase-like ring-hydroxylating dioxygenase large terminal subunit
MLSAEENRRLTETGPGTEMGRLMRRYWQPAALSEELTPERPVCRVTLMGEPLTLFRDESGRLGLIGRHCPHRGADLCYGRLEDGGLRCPFHGWLFDVDGKCLEQPAEPVDSRLHERIQHTAYPCLEKNGVIFAYLGEGEPPPLPAIDAFDAPASHAFAFKGLWECNWLQAMEVGIDPAHASYLHRFLEDEEQDYGLQFRDKLGADAVPMTRVLREYARPEIKVEDTGFGFRIVTLRNLDNQGMHVRVTNQLFPNAVVIPMSNEMTISQWHVPVTDTSCYWYSMFTSFGAPVDRDTMRAQRLELMELPDYTPRINRSNDYGYDPAEQRTETYTGMGHDINVHDQWAVESMGAIQDRTHENLAGSDVAISYNRTMLRKSLRALEKNGDGADLPGGAGAERPIAIDEVAPLEGWEEAWRARERERREASGWAAV